VDARPHILIVDDSPLVTGALRLLFEESGYDVTVAGTVREAVDAGTARGVHVMLLDLTLPDGDGLSVVTSLRDRGAEPRVTAALTGRDAAEVHSRCAAAGCRAVLVKPVPIAELIARVREWTAGQETPDRHVP
jgi:two-component system KDP operon response regulator KdpE